MGNSQLDLLGVNKQRLGCVAVDGVYRHDAVNELILGIAGHLPSGFGEPVAKALKGLTVQRATRGHDRELTITGDATNLSIVNQRRMRCLEGQSGIRQIAGL